MILQKREEFPVNKVHTSCLQLLPTMASDDQKKYSIMENILQKINKKYISLPDDEIKRNNRLLPFINKVVQKLRNKSSLFDNLFESLYYGGSYYDGLKVGEPSEYDLDCVLRFPIVAEPTVEPSDKPGYVQITLNLNALKAKVDEAPKYVGLEKLMDGQKLSAGKVKSWMEGLMTSILSNKGSNLTVDIDGTTHTVNIKICKNGPALTIKFQGVIDEKNLDIDIDFVPCFKFFSDQWPSKGYKPNPSKTKNTFLVVPQTPSPDADFDWRLSFQEQEKELIGGFSGMKPSIRLIKKIRDRYAHKIASYYIKTVFLWELEKNDKSLWQKPLSYVFMIMLKKYTEYIEAKNIPYYWNPDCNLIKDLSDNTLNCIANNLKNIISNVDRNFCTDPYIIAQYFLVNEGDLESLKKEAPLGIKQLRKIGNKATDNQTVESSSDSGFEEINQQTNEPSSSLHKLETICLSLSAEQKRLVQLLETANKVIHNLRDEVGRLNEELEAQKDERIQMMEMMKLLDKKIDGLIKKEETASKSDLELLFDDIDVFKRTTVFQAQ